MEISQAQVRGNSPLTHSVGAAVPRHILGTNSAVSITEYNDISILYNARPRIKDPVLWWPGVRLASAGSKLRSLTRSAASSGSRSSLSAAQRYSKLMFRPSTYPRSLNPWRNDSNVAGGVRPEDADPRNSRALLRGGGRRHHQGSGGCREERPPIHHWINSSARPSTDCGMVSPSALAVLRLITSSTRAQTSVPRPAVRL